MEGEAPVTTTYVSTSGSKANVRGMRPTPSSMSAKVHMLHSNTTFSPETARMWSRPLRRKSSIRPSSTPSSSSSTMPCTTSRTGGARPRRR